MAKRNDFFVSPTKIKHLHIQMGFLCNLRCKMCFQLDHSLQMRPVIWKERLLPVYPYVKTVDLQGGEPTVIGDCPEAMRLILRANPEVRFGVLTNGLRFDATWQQTFVEHGYMVNFSLNGASAATHEAINVHSDFQKVLRNVADTVARRQAAGSALKISLSFVIMEDNIHELAQFVALGQRLGADVRFFFDRSRLPSDCGQVIEAVQQAWELAEAGRPARCVEGLGTFFQYYCHKKQLEGHDLAASDDAAVAVKGRVPWDSLYVAHTGMVQCCCMSHLVLGNCLSQDILELWNNNRAQRFRECLSRDDFRHCQTACVLNTHPRYGLTPSKLQGYWDKFRYEFTDSPAVALKKAVRKARQYL